jgi:hypothetical protein
MNVAVKKNAAIDNNFFITEIFGYSD